VPRAPTRQTIAQELQFWNAIALAIFILLAGVALWLVARFGPDEITVGFLDFLVLALASFRLAHLFTDDKIFDFVRALVFDRAGARLTKANRGWRRVACELFECLWCAGLWSALFVVTIYFLGLWGVFIDVLLAVAGLGSLLAVVSRALARS
jgi:Protein of unknown function (DUF1360)